MTPCCYDVKYLIYTNTKCTFFGNTQIVVLDLFLLLGLVLQLASLSVKGSHQLPYLTLPHLSSQGNNLYSLPLALLCCLPHLPLKCLGGHITWNGGLRLRLRAEMEKAYKIAQAKLQA